MESNEMLTELMKKRKHSLHARMEKKYKKVELMNLEDQKKRLEELRSFKVPIDRQAINEHMNKYEDF
jgi:hypothetical protein